MEALWDMEEKWKLTTQEAIILLACAASAVIGLCTALVLKRKAHKKKKKTEKNIAFGLDRGSWSEPTVHWVSVKRVLMGSARWSEATKWERQPPLLGGGLGWQSHNSESPVWQRPILMGEKCELPRFSGLILYDERGRLLDQSLEQQSQILDTVHQEQSVAVVRTTLKDLL